MQITCLTLSHIHFLLTEIYIYTLSTARQKLVFIQDNWRQTGEFRGWASELKLLKGIKPYQWSKKEVKRNLEQMQARTNLKTRKSIWRKFQFPSKFVLWIQICKWQTDRGSPEPGACIALHCLGIRKSGCYFPKPLVWLVGCGFFNNI